jgi:hypothetical protein
VRDKKIEGISDLRDESDRDGMRIVIELKRDAIPHIVLNQLYKHTQMQSTFGVIMLALVNGVPRVLNLKEMLLLRRAPARGGGAPHRVRAGQGARARAHPRGAQDRRRQHRRGDPDHPGSETTDEAGERLRSASRSPSGSRTRS